MCVRIEGTWPLLLPVPQQFSLESKPWDIYVHHGEAPSMMEYTGLHWHLVTYWMITLRYLSLTPTSFPNCCWTSHVNSSTIINISSCQLNTWLSGPWQASPAVHLIIQYIPSLSKSCLFFPFPLASSLFLPHPFFKFFKFKPSLSQALSPGFNFRPSNLLYQL